MAGARGLKLSFLCLVYMAYKTWASSSTCSYVRLVDNSSLNAGRVEVYYNDYWRSICDTNWNLQNAHVICRMLGYTQGAIADMRGFQGSGDSWLSSVNCTGIETTIESCKNVKWGNGNCEPNSRAGVACKTADQGPNVAVRLVNGSSPNEGRVEVRYYGVWGTVCQDTWDSRDAHVVCRMLNYSKPSWTGTAKVRGSGPILLDDIMCVGNEKTLEDCRVVRWGRHDCTHHQDAAVICENTAQVSVRLLGNNMNYFGGVEVNYNGTWRPVCDDTWDISDAHVVCRMLGYKAAIMGMKRFSVRNTSSWMSTVECSGDELSISGCYHRGWSSAFCPRSLTAAAYCKVSEVQLPNTAVRLVNGSIPNQGRVEVRYYGVWGTVCDDRWDLADAHVVCRMLNYSKASWAGKAAVKGSGYILLDEVSCRGNEKSLEQCRQQGWGQHNCEHSEDAGVTCAMLTPEESSIAIRIVGIKHEHFGFVEVKYNGTWRPVCDDAWDISDAHVVCRMLGYKAALAAMRGFRVEISRELWMGGLECSDDDVSISECYHRGWSNTICPGNFSAGILCQPANDSSPLQVRLEDGSSPNSGRVAVRYGNVWGTICNRGLDIHDAKVICRMLGYPGASKVYPKSTYRPGNGPVWLSNPECDGTEKTIAECRHPGWGNTTEACDDGNDGAVSCKIADAPGFQISRTKAITESTVMISFNDSQRTARQLESMYQVAVEKRRNEERFKSYEQPPIFVFNDLNVTMATQMGNDSYITAEIPGPLSNLTIGDGQYYHGYYNAPLEPGSMYRVHVRIVTMAMDGTRVYGQSGFVAFTTKLSKSPSQTEGKSVQCGNTATLERLVIGLAVILIVLLLMVIGYCAWRNLKKKKRNQKDTSTQMSDIVIMNLVPSEPHETHEPVGQLSNEQISNTTDSTPNQSKSGSTSTRDETTTSSDYQTLNGVSQAQVNDGYDEGIIV